MPFAKLVRAYFDVDKMERRLKKRSLTDLSRADLLRGLDDAREVYELLREKFEERYGEIVQEYYCRRSVGGLPVGACLVTKADPGLIERYHVAPRQIWTVLNTGSDRLLSMERRIHILVEDADAVTFGSARRRKGVPRPNQSRAPSPSTSEYGGAGSTWRKMMSPLAQRRSLNAWAFLRQTTDNCYDAVTQISSAADQLANRRATGAEKRARLEAASRSVTALTQRLEVWIQREARWPYFLGVLWGTPVAIVLSVLVFWASAGWAHGSWSVDTRGLVAATSMGALGAAVSVFQRLSKGQLTIDFTAPAVQRIVLGSVRPLVGAVFGAVVQFVLSAGLLSFAPQATNSAVALFAAAGFLAGFSERFATDAVERAGKVLADTTEEPRSAGPSFGGPAIDEAIRSPVRDEEVEQARLLSKARTQTRRKAVESSPDRASPVADIANGGSPQAEVHPQQAQLGM